MSVNDSKKLNIIPYILFGLISVGFGLSIYVMLPLSLLKQNYGLILDVFFAILFGLLLGITLLVSNFQAFLEIILLYTLLIWEKKSMRILLRKNLMLHRKRNKLTSLIYSVTLGAVIFLITSASLTLKSITNTNTFFEADIWIAGNLSDDESQILLAENVDPVLVKYKD